RREHAYRGELPATDLDDRVALVVDDGLATGATMRAAVAALRTRHTRAVVVAVPVAASTIRAELARHADVTVCAHTKDPLVSVGMWYEDFTPTSDEEVRALLLDAARRHR